MKPPARRNKNTSIGRRHILLFPLPAHYSGYN